MIFSSLGEVSKNQRSLCLLHLVGFSLTKLLKILEGLLFKAWEATTILSLHLPVLALKSL
jgi:hypothetical protein